MLVIYSLRREEKNSFLGKMGGRFFCLLALVVVSWYHGHLGLIDWAVVGTGR